MMDDFPILANCILKRHFVLTSLGLRNVVANCDKLLTAGVPLKGVFSTCLSEINALYPSKVHPQENNNAAAK